MLAQLIQKNVSRLSAMNSAYQLVKDPNQLSEVLNLSERILEIAEPEHLEMVASELADEPQAREAISKRYRLKPGSYKRFAMYPKGSLGRAYYEHLTKNGIDPEALAPSPVRDDIEYIRAHFYETHDIWHTVTGFDISVAGELGLAAFTAAQFPSVFNWVLLSGGLLNTALHEFEDRAARMDAIVRGWTMGKEARRLFGMRWDGLWKKPLQEVRADFGIR